MIRPRNNPSTVENAIQPPRTISRSLSIQHLDRERCKIRGHNGRVDEGKTPNVFGSNEVRPVAGIQTGCRFDIIRGNERSVVGQGTTAHAASDRGRRQAGGRLGWSRSTGVYWSGASVDGIGCAMVTLLTKIVPRLSLAKYRAPVEAEAGSALVPKPALTGSPPLHENTPAVTAVPPASRPIV